MIKTIKSTKGITLISLVIYVIVMLIVVTIIGSISSFFYSNVNEEYKQEDSNEVTLEMYLTNDLKNKKVEAIEVKSNYFNAIFDDETYILYTITDDGIYRNRVKVYNIKEEDNFEFSIQNISPENSLIYEKQELILLKNEQTFKSYTINKETKVVYPTPVV